MTRSFLIDGVKATAAQIIVLHHISLYTPMADWLTATWPHLLAFIEEDGRLAVQPFLVIGGYLAGRSLNGSGVPHVPRLLWQRYQRLLPHFLVALVLVVGVTWLMQSHLAGEEWVSPLPSPGVFLAHLFFIQDVLGVPSLSAGAWYVAIDLQLYALFLLVARWAARRARPLAESRAPMTVALLTMASILVFSRLPELDAWAVYFFSAYGLGVLVGWAASSRSARHWLLLTILVLLLDWLIEPRERPLLALATALALVLVGSTSGLRPATILNWPGRVLRFWSDASYGIFVSHFAVILLMSGLWEAWDLHGIRRAGVFIALTWALSMVAGVGVDRLVTRAQSLWRGRRPTAHHSG